MWALPSRILSQDGSLSLVHGSKASVETWICCPERHWPNCEVGLGYGVHRGTDDGNVERDFAGQPGTAVGLAREDFAACRDEEHVVEGESFGIAC